MQSHEKLIKALIDNDVEFILIGGYAAVVHGSSMLTQDIDVCTNFSVNNAKKIINTLKKFNPIHRDKKIPFSESAEALSKFKNLYLITDLGPIDMLTEVLGLGSFTEILPHTIEIELFDHKCKVLDLDSIIKAKEAMTRPKDKETVLQLMAIREKLKEL